MRTYLRTFFVVVVALFVSSAFAIEGTATKTVAPVAMPAMTSGQLISHATVVDYAKWRAIFDADESSQHAATLTNPHVYQSMGNPNEVVIMFDMADEKKAKEFTTSKTLKAKMKKAGVTHVTFWYMKAAS